MAAGPGDLTRTYNAASSLALLCPVTSSAKGYPFEVRLPTGLPVVGVILADQIRALDWRARGAQHVGRAPVDVVDDVLARLAPLLS
jgi:mRNA interferase MazF